MEPIALKPAGPAEDLAILETGGLDPWQFMSQMAKTYGDVVYYRKMGQDIYQLNRPQDVYEVLVGQAENFRKPPIMQRVFEKHFGAGLFTYNDEEHRQRRRIVIPMYHANRYASYAEMVINTTQAIIAQWKSGEVYDMEKMMLRLTLIISAQMLFGIEISADVADEFGAAETLIQKIMYRKSRPGTILPPAHQHLTLKDGVLAKETMDRIIRTLVQERLATGEIRNDLLSMLLEARDEAGNPLSESEIYDELLLGFIAVHESSSKTLTWLWTLVTQHPEVEAKLDAEVREVLGQRTAEYQDAAQLNYTQMVIKETLRVFPPAWLITRQAKAEVTISEYRFPAESVMVFSPHIMHQNPEYFPEPARFLPERFANQYDRKLPQCAYFPFGSGQRACVGQGIAMFQIALIVASIMQRFRLETLPGQLPEPEFFTLPLAAKRGAPMRIIAREEHS